jgi:Zn-dependent protease with chaperone function
MAGDGPCDGNGTAGALVKRGRTSFMNGRARALLATVLALSMSVAIADAQTKIKSGFNLFSAEQDVEIGRQSAGQIEQQMPLLSDRQVEAYLNAIGKRLAQNAGGPGFPYTFRVVNASDINAFALPGGPIYINRGIIDNARNEGEVAGVLAHEIAHVALRHGTHQASKAYAAQAGLNILGGLLGGRIGQNTASIINAVGGFGLNALFLRFSREMETQADVRGAQILAASGYSPADMISFFQTLARVDKSKKTNWLSDHPAPPDRVARINKEAQLLRVAQTPTTNVAELNQIKSRMRTSYGTAPTMAQIARSGPAAGRTTSSTARQRSTGPEPATSVAAPSTSLRTYTSRSGVYRIAYPSNWQVYEEGTTGVTIAPSGGIGNVNGRTEVVYGAVINHYEPFGATAGRGMFSSGGTGVYTEVTLESATDDLLGQIQQTSPYLRAIRNSTQRFNISGGTALAASLRGTNPNTRIQERVTVVTRKLEDDHLIYMLFVTPEREASQYANLLNAMVRSIQIDEDHRH